MEILSFLLRSKKFRLIAILFIFQTACASKSLIRDHEYESTVNAFKSGNYEEASKKYPKGEPNGFITTLERSWISLARRGPAESENLIKQSRYFENRKTISVKKSASTFLVSSTEEDYLPSEHEVVVHHLVTAMTLISQNDYAKARVEALAASLVLQNNFDQGNVEFDDPSLRVWAATIWILLGEWNIAQVDLRAAAKLDPSKSLDWIENKSPPKYLNIVFQGSGPSLEYGPSFPPKFITNKVKINSGNSEPANSIIFKTDKWFAWQHDRNLNLQEFADKSNYMTRFSGQKAFTATDRTLSFLGAHSLTLLGVALGTTIAVGGIALGFALKIDASDYYALVGSLGLTTASYFYTEGTTLNSNLQKNITNDENKRMAELKIYRYVRFLPDQILFNFSDERHMPFPTPQLALTNKDQSHHAHFFWIPKE